MKKRKEGKEMDTPIIRAEHEEFRKWVETEKKRLADEDERQNNRLKLLEEDVRQISVLTTAVEKLAMSIESMVKEQASQGKRLEELENRDGEMWRKVTGYIITAIVGILIGFIFKQIGM